MPTLKQVLIVEDNTQRIAAWKSELNRYSQQINIVVAESIEDARSEFQKNPTPDLIVMDCCVPGDDPNTMDLVKEIRENYRGPILANSSAGAFYTDKLIRAGASHACSKGWVPKEILKLLGIQPAP
ncbi:response regulator [Candidatus Nomurabacteria bacterium]|nr:response regulator [Candidatus Nomurabacteria bacterium]